MVKPILLLGNDALYQVSAEVLPGELPSLRGTVEDLHDTLMDFRARYGRGRAIAAPQIGVAKRIIYLNIDAPTIIINPSLHFPGDELIEVMDDCMSFPELIVRVMRHRQCMLRYKNMDWQSCELLLEDDMAELIQHEYDHLDGILATMRAIDDKSLFACTP